MKLATVPTGGVKNQNTMMIDVRKTKFSGNGKNT
jgi:hypothetical protein